MVNESYRRAQARVWREKIFAGIDSPDVARAVRHSSQFLAKWPHVAINLRLYCWLMVVRMCNWGRRQSRPTQREAFHGKATSRSDWPPVTTANCAHRWNSSVN